MKDDSKRSQYVLGLLGAAGNSSQSAAKQQPSPSAADCNRWLEHFLESAAQDNTLDPEDVVRMQRCMAFLSCVTVLREPNCKVGGFHCQTMSVSLFFIFFLCYCNTIQCLADCMRSTTSLQLYRETGQGGRILCVNGPSSFHSSAARAVLYASQRSRLCEYQGRQSSTLSMGCFLDALWYLADGMPATSQCLHTHYKVR